LSPPTRFSASPRSTRSRRTFAAAALTTATPLGRSGRPPILTDFEPWLRGKLDLVVCINLSGLFVELLHPWP
jgi:hypothetical protein